MTKTVFATFSDPKLAQQAAGALLDHGVRSEHISIIFPEGFEHTNSDYKDSSHGAQRSAETGISTTTLGDAESGAAKGAGIGLAAGAIAALASVFIPGIGLVLGGGALAIALGGTAGTAAAGAIAGGVTGYLKDQGVSHEAIESYDRVLRAGGATITVSPTDENIDLQTIEQLINKYSGTFSLQSTTSTYVA